MSVRLSSCPTTAGDLLQPGQANATPCQSDFVLDAATLGGNALGTMGGTTVSATKTKHCLALDKEWRPTRQHGCLVVRRISGTLVPVRIAGGRVGQFASAGAVTQIGLDQAHEG